MLRCRRNSKDLKQKRESFRYLAIPLSTTVPQSELLVVTPAQRESKCLTLLSQTLLDIPDHLLTENHKKPRRTTEEKKVEEVANSLTYTGMHVGVKGFIASTHTLICGTLWRTQVKSNLAQSHPPSWTLALTASMFNPETPLLTVSHEGTCRRCTMLVSLFPTVLEQVHYFVTHEFSRRNNY